MKRLFACLLALMLAFSLCACQESQQIIENLKNVELPPLPEATEEPAPTGDAADEPQEAPAETEPVSGEPAQVTYEALELENRVTVKTDTTQRYEEYDPQNGEELILSFSYVSPHVSIQGRDEAAQAINDYLAMLDETYYTGNDYGAGTAMGYNMMLELAQDNYGYAISTGEDVELTFAASRTTAVARSDGAVLSLVYDDYSFTGGAHPNSGQRGYVFDTQTGARLSLEDLSGDYGALSEALTAAMVKRAEEDTALAAQLDASITEGKSYEELFSPLLRDGSWYLSEEGIVIFSDQEELSSYAAGPVRFEIPYGELEGVLDAKWLPEEKPGEGRFTVASMDAFEDGTVEIIDLVTDGKEGGEDLCLTVEGTVYDVSITGVYYSDSFYETSYLWNASHMSGCAVQLQAVLPDGMPELMIRYSSGGQEHRVLLTHGEDGGPALVDDSIEAVG